MAPKLNENYTSFGVPQQNQGRVSGSPWWMFWKRFTGTTEDEYQEAFDDMPLPEDELININPLRGDAVANDDPTAPTSFSFQRRTAHVPQTELNRRKRYRDFEDMDLHPEIAAALDMYANDSTIADKSGDIVKIQTSHESIKQELRALFKKIRLKDFLWDIVRGTAKYGDFFVENIVHPRKKHEGIQRIKFLDPNFIFREEDQYGILKSFYQEIPTSNTGYTNPTTINKDQRLPLDRNQLVHFQIKNAEAQFIPYGKSILAPAAKIYKQLRLMEDAMFIYRVQRAPERRVFYIDVGQLPPHKARMVIEEQKRVLKKEKYYDPAKGKIDERFNPAATNEDFFLPTRQGSETKIDTLPGADNLGEIDDVKYFREKILAALKIPKDYFSMGDSGKSDTNKGTLRQLDVNYARAVCRLQQKVCRGLETLCQRHLTFRGYPATLINEFEIELNSPKHAEEHETLELEEARARVLQAYKGTEMLPNEYILEKILGLNDEEIQDLKSKLKKQLEEEMEMMGGMEDPMGMGQPANPMEAMPEEESPGGQEQTVNGDMRDNSDADSDTGSEEEK